MTAADHVVIGTAGHVDHGKTTLVKALTGVDTDRWDEEKRRGITIDLGFARLDLPGGISASVVDVPGHEDFIRNMVAGAAGVDVAMLVVAADEGIMPQTREHLAILEFLGVTRGVPVITKTDLAERDWIELVDTELHEILGTSSIDWSGSVMFNSRDGEARQVADALGLAAVDLRSRSSGDVFRLPVDRVFSVAGAGTVVTGTVWSGTVAVGDQVRVLPGDRAARVRSIEVHGEAVDAARPGRRCALALVGVSPDKVGRGASAVTGDGWRTTDRIDVLTRFLSDVKPPGQRTRVRVHLGTAEVMARVTVAADRPAGKSPTQIRLRLERPLVARAGDLGVLRSYSPVTTIGGFTVVDPYPPLRPRRPVDLVAKADAEIGERLRAFVAHEGRVKVGDLVVRHGVDEADLDETLRTLGGRFVLAGDVLYSTDAANRLDSSIVEAVERFHLDHPLEPGIPTERVRSLLGPSKLLDAALEQLKEQGALSMDAGCVRLLGFEARLEGAAEIVAREITEILEISGREGRTAGELDATNGIRAGVLRYLLRRGDFVRIGGDRYLLRTSLETMARRVAVHLAEAGRAKPGELRGVLGLSRKYLIPVLEWLDEARITARDGDYRITGPKAANWMGNPIDKA